MEREDKLQNLVDSTFLLTKLQGFIGDNFFFQKFEIKTREFIRSYIDFKKEEEGSNVAQYQVLFERCIANIDAISELMKELQYLNFIRTSPLLLRTEQSLLRVKLEIMRNRKVMDSVKEKGIISIPEKNSIPAEVLPKRKNIEEKAVLNQNKKKILDFIKSYPNSRTKDIIYEFNAISDRTVKRSLNELLRIGLVRKKVDNKAVYYYPSDIQI